MTFGVIKNVYVSICVLVCSIYASSHTDSFVAQTGFLWARDDEERRTDRAARARVARFVFLFVTVRCYAIQHSFSF